MQKIIIFRDIIMSAEQLALNETVRRLKLCRTYVEHDPLCMCDNPEKCLKTAKMCEPTEWAIEPMQIFKKSQDELFKQTLKKALIAEASPPKEPDNYVFVTISAAPDILLPDFVKKFHSFIKTKMFHRFVAVLEQRGTIKNNNVGLGFHAHILFKRITPLGEGLPPTNIKRNIRQSWKKYCDSKSNQILNIQFIPTAAAPGKEEYILGEKRAEGKPEKQEGDKVWRRLRDIQTYYGDPEFVFPDPSGDPQHPMNLKKGTMNLKKGTTVNLKKGTTVNLKKGTMNLKKGTAARTRPYIKNPEKLK